MKYPTFLTAPALGLCVLCAGLASEVTGEGGVEAGQGATLDQLAKIPASEFTKIIENSTSPDKRLAVVLGSMDGKKPDWEEENFGGRGGAIVPSFFLEDCRNYVVDVKADRVTGILDATHFGTRNRYNHESHHIAWSPDGRWLVETRSWKWYTEICTVHRLDAGGRPVARLDLVKAAGEIVDTWFREHSPKLTAEQRDRYVVTISVDSIADDGTLMAGISAEIPKDEDADYVSVLITAKVQQTEDGELTLQGSKVVGRE